MKYKESEMMKIMVSFYIYISFLMHNISEKVYLNYLFLSSQLYYDIGNNEYYPLLIHMELWVQRIWSLKFIKHSTMPNAGLN